MRTTSQKLYDIILNRLRAWEDEFFTNKYGFQKNALLNIGKLNIQLSKLKKNHG